MTKQEILNGMSEEEFYSLYPTRQAWEQAQQQMAYGGMPDIMGVPFGAGMMLADGGIPYYGGPIYPAQYGRSVFTEKKMSPQQWEKYNIERGYQKIPGGKAQSNKPGAYAEFYNPKEYARSEEAWGNGPAQAFTKVGAPSGYDYNKDPNYKPIVQYGYKEPVVAKPVKPWTPAGQVAGSKEGLFYKDQNPALGKFAFREGKYTPYMDEQIAATTPVPTAAASVINKYGGAPCYECGGGHMEDGGIFNYGQFPAMQDGAAVNPNLLWAQQEQLAAQKRAGYNIPKDAKPAGTNPLYYNPFLKGSDVAEVDSMHTSPYDENIKMYFKNGKPIIGPANDSGIARKTAADINRRHMFVGKDNIIYPNYLAKQSGGAFDQSNNQNYPRLNDGGYGWVKDAIASVNSRKAGGDVTEQGGNQDFLTQRNEYVRNYIQKMVDRNIRQEEAQKVEDAFIQMDSQMPPVGVPPMAYGGYMQAGGGPGIYYNQPYDEVNSRNEASGMAAETQYNTLQNNRKQAWGNLLNSFGENSFDPNNFYAQEGKIVQNKDESWEDYQERIREDKAGREGGSGRHWDGTRWVKDPEKTEQTNPWANLAEAGNPEGYYSKWIPDNDIRTGYRFGKKDFAELSKLDPNLDKTSRIKYNYGPLGRFMPRVFGPKSVTIDTASREHLGAFEEYRPPAGSTMQTPGQPSQNDIYQSGLEKYNQNKAYDALSRKEKRDYRRSANEMMEADEERMKGPEEKAWDDKNWFQKMKSNIGTNKIIRQENKKYDEIMELGQQAYGGVFYAQPGGTPISYDEWEESLRFTPPAIDDSEDQMPPSLITGNEKEQTEEEALADVAGIQKRRAEQNDMFGPPMDDKPDIMGAPGKSYTAKKKTTGVGKALLKRSALIADTISSGLEQRQSTAKQRMKESQYGMNRFKVKPANAIDEGDYHFNSGMFRPDQDVPVQFAGYAQWGGFNTMAHGGSMIPGLYGTNGNNQFTHNGHLESGKISQKDIETRQTLGPVPRHLANLEAEGGETAIVNMGGMPAHFKIGGKRHSQGGTPLNLPDNSFIFSDTAKMKIKDPIILAQFGMVVKSGGYTPAEIAKKYDINKFRKVLADPNSENLERKTAEMMISNYNLKLAKLAMLQESKKGFPQGIPVVAMPYILENEIDPSTFLPDQAQEQLEEGAQPDAEMGVARYGANVVSQWDTHRYGGFAQEGAQTEEEPGFWSKVGHGVLGVLEAPQRAMMYAGTGLFGDREFEMQKIDKSGKPVGEFKWVTDDNVPLFEKANALGERWRKTERSQKAHYEMPGEALKRTYPNSSPILQGALDIVADPFLVSGIGKSIVRGAVKKITNSAANNVVKGSFKNATKYEATRVILSEAGKKVTARNLAIASKALKASEDAVKAAEIAKKTIDASKVSKIARKAGVAGMKEHDIRRAGELATEVVGKPLVNAAKTTAKAVKYATDKTIDLVKNVDPGPLALPIATSAVRNIGTLGLKEDVAKSKAENIRLKEELKNVKSQYIPSRTENGIGIFSNPGTPGVEYMFQNGKYVPYVPQAKKDSVLVEKPKTAPKDTTTYNWE